MQDRRHSEPESAGIGESRLAQDIDAMSRKLSEFTPSEMDSLRSMSNLGAETDITHSSVRLLIALLQLLEAPHAPLLDDKTLNLFSRIVDQLENYLPLLVNRRDYLPASQVLSALRRPMAPGFSPRISAAMKKAADRSMIARLVDELRMFAGDSPEYQVVYSYLSMIEGEVTPILLELLATEEDRSVRTLLSRILKDLGKNQIALIGERLSDERWYFVRNIVAILGESKNEEVVSYLEKVARHKNFQIRHEVVKALVAIEGRKSADLMATFLHDDDIDIRFMAIRGMGAQAKAGEGGERALIHYLRGVRETEANTELKKEAIESLGRIGGTEASRFLAGYLKRRWWKSRKPQEEVRAAAEQAIREIERRRNGEGRV